MGDLKVEVQHLKSLYANILARVQSGFSCVAEQAQDGRGYDSFF
jgi:hypothetical protein